MYFWDLTHCFYSFINQNWVNSLKKNEKKSSTLIEGYTNQNKGFKVLRLEVNNEIKQNNHFDFEWKALLLSIKIKSHPVWLCFSILNTVQHQLWVGGVVTHSATSPLLRWTVEPSLFTGRKKRKIFWKSRRCEKYWGTCILSLPRHTCCFITW